MHPLMAGSTLRPCRLGGCQNLRFVVYTFQFVVPLLNLRLAGMRNKRVNMEVQWQTSSDEPGGPWPSRRRFLDH